MLLGELQDALHRCHLAKQVNRNDGTGTGRHCRSSLVDVQVERGGVDVDEHYPATGIVDGARSGEEREWCGDDLVARLEVQGSK